MIFKINKKIIVFLVAIFIFICISFIYYNSYSFNIGNVFLSSEKNSVDKNGEFEIIINLQDNDTSAFTCYLYFDVSKVEFVSGPENVNLIDNRIIYVWHDTTGGNNVKKGEIARFKFRAKEEGVSNFVIDGEFYNSDEQLIQVNFKELQIKIGDYQNNSLQMENNDEIGTNNQNNNANLKVLRLNKEGMVPSFQDDIYEYYLSVLNNVSEIQVLAIADNPNAVVEILGNSGLKDGINKISINVSSQDKSQNNTYSIYVTKTANLELANTNLEILAIENVLLYPQFDASVTNYRAEVSNTISSLKVFAVPENESAIVNVSGNDELKVGNNFVKVSVTAADGFSKRVYNVNIYKRNQEEEVIYEEELKNNQKALEEIYKTENTKSESESEIDKNKESGKIYLKVIVGFIVVLGLILVVFHFISLYRSHIHS